MKTQFYIRGKKIDAEIVPELEIRKLEVRERESNAQRGVRVSTSALAIAEPDRFPEISELERRSLASSGFQLSRRSDSDHPGARLIRVDGELRIITRRLVVKLKPGMSEGECEGFLADRRLRILQKPAFAENLYVTLVPDDTTPERMSVSILEKFNDKVVYAEPVMRQWAHSRSANRSSSECSNQWHWAKISADKAWKTTKGNGVRVAVIDRGFRPAHEQLKDNVNDDLSVWFDDHGAHSNDLRYMPVFVHGNFCAAQVAARPIESDDVTGIAPKAELLLVCTPGAETDWLSQLDLALAVAYAASPASIDPDLPEKGADIISCAEGPKTGQGMLEGVLQDAFDFAHEKGVPMFWAVANLDTPISNDGMLSYPHLIRIGSSTKSDKVAPQCAYGKELDFLAPGHNVCNIWNFNAHRDSGTSFAAPVAAGIGALVMSIVPDLGPDDLRGLMRKSCEKVGPLSNGDERNDYYGHGRIDAAVAVDLALAKKKELSGG